MRVDKAHFRKVMNRAKYLEFNEIQYTYKNDFSIRNDSRNKELDYLIRNNIYKKILNSAKKSVFGKKMIIKRSLSKDFRSLDKYTSFFENQ